MSMSRQLIEATLSLSKKQICMHCISPVIANTIFAYMIVFHILTRFFLTSLFSPWIYVCPTSYEILAIHCFLLYSLYIHIQVTTFHSYITLICSSLACSLGLFTCSLTLSNSFFWFSLALQFIFLASEGVHQWLATRLVTLV